jgi:putative transposase
MVEKAHPRLGIARQCLLLGIGRSTFYHEAAGESPFKLKLMRLIDEQFLETPFFGARQMVKWLRRQGHGVGLITKRCSPRSACRRSR